MEMLRDNDDTSPYMEMWRGNDAYKSTDFHFRIIL